MFNLRSFASNVIAAIVALAILEYYPKDSVIKFVPVIAMGIYTVYRYRGSVLRTIGLLRSFKIKLWRIDVYSGDRDQDIDGGIVDEITSGTESLSYRDMGQDGDSIKFEFDNGSGEMQVVIEPEHSTVESTGNRKNKVKIETISKVKVRSLISSQVRDLEECSKILSREIRSYCFNRRERNQSYLRVDIQTNVPNRKPTEGILEGYSYSKSNGEVKLRIKNLSERNRSFYPITLLMKLMYFPGYWLYWRSISLMNFR